MNSRRYVVSLAFAMATGGWAGHSFSIGATMPDQQPAIVEAPLQEPIVGVGYHPGNFIGPLAFDVIVRPSPHIAADIQAGYWSLENDVHALAVAPQVQWEFLPGWQTPYLGLGFRFEEAWSDGMKATSKGGFLVGGWQCRWRSGFGVLVGVGVLYRTSINLNSSTGGYYSSGGWSGTYEGGVRYFF